MLVKAEQKLQEYIEKNDIHQFNLILDAASNFIKSLPHGVTNVNEFDLGIKLLRALVSVTLVTSLHQYEYNYDLQNEILYKKLAVFRLCIPETHKELRGLTETLVGMRENEMEQILKSLK